MPVNPIPDFTPEEQLRADNEIMALSLELSHGAITHISDDAPPEMVNAWLQNVAAYEAQHQEVPPITVYERIGRPAFALRASKFLLDLFNLKQPYAGIWLSENLRDDQDCITKDTAIRRIQQFRDGYREIKPIGFKPQEVLNSEHGTHLMFSVCWEGQPIDGAQRERHEGLGVIQMGYEEKQWLVQGVQMPGFKF